MRRYDEANGTDPVPDQVKKTCIFSNTPEPLKTHLQLNVSNFGTFDALRVATEDYLRSRRIFKTTLLETLRKMTRWKLMSYPEKRKAKGDLVRERKVARKAKRVILERVTEVRKLNTRESMVSAETVENTATKRRIVGTNNNTSLMATAKARASRNLTSQRSAKATRTNKLKRRGHQTLLLNRRVCLK